MIEADGLRELLDKQAIYENLMRYCRGVDRLDVDLIAGAFHPNAHVNTGRLIVQGPEIGPAIVDATRRGSLASSHFVGNVLIEFEGQDVALCEAYVNSMLVLEDGGRRFTRVRGSRYLDRAERRDGWWKVAVREVVDDWSRYDEVRGETPRAGQLFGRRDRSDRVYALRGRADEMPFGGGGR